MYNPECLGCAVLALRAHEAVRWEMLSWADSGAAEMGSAGASRMERGRRSVAQIQLFLTNRA